MTYHKCLKPIWKGSKSMADYCNYQSDHICPPITIAPRHPTMLGKLGFSDQEIMAIGRWSSL